MFRRSLVVMDEPSQVQQLQQQPLVRSQSSPDKPAASFEEAVAASGLLLPAVAPGGTGNAFTTAQPFQLLSWYPRHALSKLKLKRLAVSFRAQLQGCAGA